MYKVRSTSRGYEATNAVGYRQTVDEGTPGAETGPSPQSVSDSGQFGSQNEGTITLNVPHQAKFLPSSLFKDDNVIRKELNTTSHDMELRAKAIHSITLYLSGLAPRPLEY